MGYYSGRIIINNETDNIETIKAGQGLIAIFKFSVSFNKKKIFLNNSILNQFLDSTVVKDFILKECLCYFKNNTSDIDNAIKKIIISRHTPVVDIRVLGKYFYIRMYCGREHTIDECILALKRKLNNEKDRLEILRG